MNSLVIFPIFFNFSLKFGNKEFMIWTRVSSWSCFCWLYRASPSLAANNIINQISVLTIWSCPCVESSLVFLAGCLLWPMHSLGRTLLAFVLLHSVLQGQICLLLHVFLYFWVTRGALLSIVRRGCLLWPVCSLAKTLLAFVLLHSVLQGQICLLLQLFLDFLLMYSSPL